MRRIVVVLVGVVTLTVSSLIAAPPSLAAAPKVSWSFETSRVDAGAVVTVNYSTVRVRGSDVVQLQRKMGTTGVWSKVKVLKGRGSSQTITFTAPGMGKYPFRVVVVRKKDRHHKKTFAGGAQPLYVYGEVSLGVLCNNASSVYICGTDDEDTIDVGDHTFTYVGETNGFSGAEPPYWDQIIQFPATSCRSIVVDFAAQGPASSNVSTVQLIQERTDAQQASVSNGSVGTLSAMLDGSGFTVRGNGTQGDQIYVNGAADCYTSSGRA